MTTFEIQIVKCPHCGTLMTHYELMSYTVHHVEAWSDGKTEAGVPEMKRSGICAVCRQEFWIQDAVLPHDPDWQPQENLSPVMDIYDLEWIFEDDRELKAIEYYHKLIEDGYADNEDREFYLRTHLLWAINDLMRYPFVWWRARNYAMLTSILNNRKKAHISFKKFEDIYRENLDRMVFLFIKAEEPDLLYLCELYRERGNFDKALEILDKVEDKGRNWKKIKKKAGKKDDKVFKLNDD